MKRQSRPTSIRLPVRPIHPFPARMAASIALDELRDKRRPLRVLDPMVGSGTTVAVAKSQGHSAVGFDTDPLAVLLAKAWCLDLQEDAVRLAATRVLRRAVPLAKQMRIGDSYPCPEEDQETRAFVRYWFDSTNRRQLAALSQAIRGVRDEGVKTILWCAFSRLIITKQASVSLAMDLAHSRPHRVRERSDNRAFDKFLAAMEAVLSAASFKNCSTLGRAEVRSGDARSLPLPSESIDLVITSPPYLNAIDYLRCHKFTLVWMGHSINSLRELRATNIGSEVGLNGSDCETLDAVIRQMTGRKQLSARHHGMLRRYVNDMQAVIKEVSRVLVSGGRAIFVVGNSTLRGVFIKNSRAVSILGQQHGLRLLSTRARRLPNNRRYLPPPSCGGNTIHNRMRTEVVMTLKKP